MKISGPILIFFLCLTHTVISQSVNRFTDTQQQLYAELKKYPYVETQYKGYEDPDTSVVWQKADLFFERLDLEEILLSFNDSSYVIRYYAFLKLLPLNDAMAFERLTHAKDDSTSIMYWFDDAGGYINFNRLLMDEYRKFIELKYHKGGTISLGNRHYLGEDEYHFPKFNAHAWQIKYEPFKKLAFSKGIKPG